MGDSAARNSFVLNYAV